VKTSIPTVVDRLIKNKNINRTTNDRSAHLRGFPGRPGPEVAHQYRMDVREARKLVAAIAKLPKSTQKDVVAELAKRATLDQQQMPRMNGLALSENAAKVLTDLSKKLGSDTKFTKGQPFPLHPVG
jgi:hypothetical protein